VLETRSLVYNSTNTTFAHYLYEKREVCQNREMPLLRQKCETPERDFQFRVLFKVLEG
jgi:hypothetical protein